MEGNGAGPRSEAGTGSVFELAEVSTNGFGVIGIDPLSLRQLPLRGGAGSREGAELVEGAG